MRLDPDLGKRVGELIAALNNDRVNIVTVLKNGNGEITAAKFDDPTNALSALMSQIESDVARLAEQGTENALKSLEEERVLLRHRQVLHQLLPEAEAFVLNLAWVKKASGTPKRRLSPRHLTEKEGELFATLIAERYRERFTAECQALHCDLPVEFRTQGQRGQTVRSLSIKGGYSPDKILSEGEQRAVALADFLTEVSLNPANAGIVLDDPVTSQDHQRKERIAGRLVSEAKSRQVVILTHDLVFLTMLASAAEEENVDLLAHWVERDAAGQPGQISLDDCPTTTPQYRSTRKAVKTLAEARASAGSVRISLIQRGMGELRRTVEEIIPHFLLKQVVNRWSDRIIVTGLKKINWDDHLVEEVIKAYEDLSALIEGHSHTEERHGGPPEPENLNEMIDRVNSLIRRAKPDRATNRPTST